ncbi:hypothetical protein [Amycolatopsis sp. GM8]|uniref:hypothetical protein n=1 Tax=Amycolatopsis sp. GM8 TaxID=2896530 RepID=UPI001F2659BE|nr:hypothetical protein [Amycolatopsis sp. GM8]
MNSLRRAIVVGVASAALGGAAALFASTASAAPAPAPLAGLTDAPKTVQSVLEPAQHLTLKGLVPNVVQKPILPAVGLR